MVSRQCPFALCVLVCVCNLREIEYSNMLVAGEPSFDGHLMKADMRRCQCQAWKDIVKRCLDRYSFSRALEEALKLRCLCRL
jgi:hypothetical protein